MLRMFLVCDVYDWDRPIIGFTARSGAEEYIQELKSLEVQDDPSGLSDDHYFVMEVDVKS